MSRICRLKIDIEDDTANNVITVQCTGDTDIMQHATPAQVLARKVMDFIEEEIGGLH